ncbi:MAG: 16S rRNA (guanine(527)-N(7))-methyltransferase RsmG [Eubacterium sp.]|nr:16S rRNA (guanine(527)-N(7))-methyltransferase RsmG [Eubacterium sp.]
MKDMEAFKQSLQLWNIEIRESQIKKMMTFNDLLQEANKKMNLTAICETEEAMARHFLDSLSLMNTDILQKSGEAGIKAENVSEAEKISENIGKTEKRESKENSRETDSIGKTEERGSKENSGETDNIEKNEKRNPVKLIDVGTGAGFPGMPLGIANPEISVTLLDSLNKRIQFLEEAVEELETENITPIWGRAEELARDERHREQYDIAVSRAVADLSVLCEYCLPFVKQGGCFAAYKGSDISEETERAEKAIEILGGSAEEVLSYQIPGTEIHHSLVLIRKTGPTPDKYPRRAGMPAKKPLK